MSNIDKSLNYKTLVIGIVIIGICVSVLFFFKTLHFEADELASSSTDRMLSKIIKIHNLKPMQVRSFYPDPLYKFGQLLFFDPVLSGERNVSCATCHEMEKGLSDGRKNSNNFEVLRTKTKTTDQIVESYRLRNAPDLWNRDANENVALFWDGRIEVLDPERLMFRSIMGEKLYSGFTNLLEIQSIFPLATEDEMKGKEGNISSNSLPFPHAGKQNEIAKKTGLRSEVAQITYSQKKVVDRVLGRSKKNPEDWQLQYREYFFNAFPELTLNDASIMHFGKAIGHFEEFAFASHDSRWDFYLKGDTSVLSKGEKKGAILFYAKGLCAACHTGRLFSDGQYHNVGIVSAPIKFEGHYLEDLGRFAVTGQPNDKYKFKTPQLRNVTKSAPYFHDGSSEDISKAIKRHANLMHGGEAEYFESGHQKLRRRHFRTLSPLHMVSSAISDEEISSIVDFLGSLEAQSRSNAQIIPKSVPSGLISYSR